MPDYKELFYQSQAALANAVEALEALTEQLRWCMMSSEDAVASDEPEDSAEQST